MAQRPVVRWNAAVGRWMAWVRFPDGTRKKVERVEKADAQRDLDELLSVRALGSTPVARGLAQVTFDEILDEWFAAGCPNVLPTKASRHARVKSPNTIANARQLLGTSVRPVIGRQWVHRTTTERLMMEAIPVDPGPAMWLTGLVCGLRPGTPTSVPAGRRTSCDTPSCRSCRASSTTS